MRRSTRRQFLVSVTVPAALGWAAARARAGQLPSQFFDQMRACDPNAKPTPALPAGPDFRPDAVARTSFVAPGVAGTRFHLSGQVAGVRCGPIKDARLDFWQADAAGRFAPGGTGLRGYQQTNAAGNYHLETIVPGAEAGGARILHARVQPPKGAALTTGLFFADDPRAARAPGYQPVLVLTLKDTPAGKAATFDFILDL